MLDKGRRERLRRAGLGVALGGLSGMLCKDVGLPAAVSYTGSEVFLVLCFALIGGFVALTPTRRVAVAVPALLAALWLVVALTPLSASAVTLTERVDPEETGDAIFVFSSSIQPDGEPDVGSMARTFHGVELAARGRAPALVVSEAGEGQGAGNLARAWTSELHLATEVLDVGRIGNTHDEAVALAALAKTRGWTRIVAVTSPTHSKRACATLERQGLVAIASPSSETRFDLPALPSADDRLRAFAQILHEVVGSWTYRRRGWI